MADSIRLNKSEPEFHTLSYNRFYDLLDEVMNEKIWDKEGQFIDKFLKNYTGTDEVKYRFWEEDKKLITYLSIRFPKPYTGTDKIYLKDILNEKEGVKFSFILMKKNLDSEVKN